jgi:hypothetical protein
VAYKRLFVSYLLPCLIKAWELSLNKEIPAPFGETSASVMSASVEASELLKRLAEPAPAGAHIETLIRSVARKVGLSFSRTKALWYREAAVVRSEEMDALRALDRTRDEAEGELRREYQELIARIEQLEHGLAEARANLRGG